jgi:hypothetical protein
MQKDYEELASQIMAIVELLVQKTKEKIESSTDVLKSIIAPLIDSDEEIVWPPRNPQAFADMRKEVDKRDKGNYLDESFLSEVSAQLRQANEDADKPGLVAILQKVLQLYAAGVLSKRSYAAKGVCFVVKFHCKYEAFFLVYIGHCFEQHYNPHA